MKMAIGVKAKLRKLEPIATSTSQQLIFLYCERQILMGITAIATASYCQSNMNIIVAAIRLQAGSCTLFFS